MELRTVDEKVLRPRRDRGAVEVDEPDLLAERHQRVGIDAVMGDARCSERGNRLPRPRRRHVVRRKGCEGMGGVEEHEHGVARRRLGGSEHVARRHTGPLREQRDERLVLDRLEPAAAQARAVVGVQRRPPDLLEQLRVVGVAPVHLHEQGLARRGEPARDEDAGGLPVGRLELLHLDAELTERRGDGVRLRVSGRGAEREADHRRGDERDEERQRGCRSARPPRRGRRRAAPGAGSSARRAGAAARGAARPRGRPLPRAPPGAPGTSPRRPAAGRGRRGRASARRRAGTRRP